MSNKPNTLGIIIASVLITLVVTGTGMYFGLPLLFPNLTADLSEYDQSEEIENITTKGILLQTQYAEFTQYLSIYDSDLVPEIMTGTNLTITTQGSSKLHVIFTENFVARFGPSFSGDAIFNVTLSIVGIQNKTLSILESRMSATGTQEQQNRFAQITLETATLPAATYSIIMYWYSTQDPTGSAYLFTYDSRALYAQEIAV
ncbi:hypothetical protein NEF87_001781 [Candidatus Lokiarchaeum ossiferum]|uniref:Uncharacterized protein n=1 Tax=Candidatus Lokiarchaeum ossiferum TaxID=2951803 RepID=A0ABY6HSG8_9ARCH|nr:hypothetical protein NEF87_001781 [Candidatus Lokiarchaeum sp. B-35]